MLKNVPLEPLTSTSNGVVPVEVMDTDIISPVNISTDLIPTSEKKKKRKKARRSKNPKTTTYIDDDDFKGMSLENTKAERIDPKHHASFEDTLPQRIHV